MYEETGYDISPLILPDAFLELQIKEQRVKLYIIPGVPTATPMSPQTRKEISSIGWIHLADLPGYSKKNKNAHPGIKLYMVTPFLSGLRKWISQNRHMKGKMIPAEEEGLLEDAIQDEVVQNGTTDDLIAMLRRQQPPEQEVDLLGMLRNGNTGQPQYQMPWHPTESYSPQDAMSYTFQQPTNGQQVYDLMEFSPRIEPTRDPVQEPVQPPPPPPPINPIDSINQERQESLLSILKGGPPKPITEKKEANTFLLDLFKGSKQTASDVAAVVELPKSEHQQNLLSMLRSPELSSTIPPIRDTTPMRSAPSTKAALGSENLPFLATLKSPPQRPTFPSTESHQHALLATLKSSPRPSGAPQNPPSKPSPAPPVASHQNNLLSALKSPKVESQTDHKASLLATLNKSPPSKPAAKLVSTAPSDKTTSTQPRVDTASFLLARVHSPPVPRSTPNRDHETSLLSALKSPTLPVALSTLPASPSAAHTSSLLSMLKGSSMAPAAAVVKDEGNVVENKPSDVKNVHMESLLKTLKSPSVSPATAKVTPPEMKNEAGPKKTEVRSHQINAPRIETADVNDVEKAEAPKVGHAASASGHVNSLLSTLKGPRDQFGQLELGATSGKISPSISTAKNNQPIVTDNSKQTQTAPQTPSSTASAVLHPIASSATAVQTPVVTVNALLDSLKGKSTPPAPVAPIAHQKSLLSVLNPSARRTESPPSKTPPKPQQFNFSPNPQVGKRIKFRETLTPGGGITESQPEPKPNGNAIDLGKVKLLRRPIPEPPIAHAESGHGTDREESQKRLEEVIGRGGEETNRDTYRSLPSSVALSHPNLEHAGTIHTETGNITVLKRPEPAAEATANKPDSAPMDTKRESPLGIEFPFRRRTPSKSSRGSPTPTNTPTKAHSQSLLALLKGPPAEIDREETLNEDRNFAAGENVESPPGSAKLESGEGEEDKVHLEAAEDTEHVGTEREMKLIAMLERALARGIPS